MSACLPPGPGPQYVGPVLRRYRPTITIVVGFLLGLLLATLDKMFPPGHAQGPIAVIAVIVDWTAPPLAGTLVAAALLVAQRYKRLHDAERAASKILAERLTGTERRQALWVVAAAIAHDLKNPLHNLQLLMEELDEESDPGKRGELIARLRENVHRAAGAAETRRRRGSHERHRDRRRLPARSGRPGGRTGRAQRGRERGGQRPRGPATERTRRPAGGARPAGGRRGRADGGGQRSGHRRRGPPAAVHPVRLRAREHGARPGHRKGACPRERRRADLHRREGRPDLLPLHLPGPGGDGLRPTPLAPRPAEREDGSVTTSEAPARATSPRLLLLVEDEADARTILARRLQAFGWNCLAHPSVETALRDPQLRYVEAVVADVVLGEGRMSGIDLIPALRKEDVRAPVVLVTAFADQQRVKDALNAGAAYLLEKPFTTEALRGVLDKVTSVDVDLAKLVNKALSKARLTRKEEEVARLVLKGLTSAEIGAMMGNSEKTIKQHLTQVYAKLGVAGRAEFFHLVFPS